MLKRGQASAAALAFAVCAVSAGCGGSSSSGSAGSSTSSGSGGAGANVAAAQAVLQKFDKPTPFPIDQPLPEKLAPSQHLGYLYCGAPACSIFAQLYDVGTRTMGISPIDSVKSGLSADGIQSALSSILAKKPAAVLLPGVNLASLGSNLPKFTAAGIPVVALGINATPAQGISASIGPVTFRLGGQILADWSIVNAGEKANVVFYGNPELDFTKAETEAFKTELSKNCPSCKARFVDIPVSTIGSTAPSRVVSDLQAHPDTKAAVFANLETATGLAAALKTAGIRPKIAGYGPGPSNLQDMKAGDLDAAVGVDTPVEILTSLDAAVRLVTKQPLTEGEKNGDIPIQLVTKANVPANVTFGFQAYPDYVQRFSALWAKARTAK